MSLFRPRLLKNLKLVIENYLKIKKTHLNVTAIFSIYTPIIKTKSVKPYTKSLAIKLQDFFIKFLVFKGGVSKVI